MFVKAHFILHISHRKSAIPMGSNEACICDNFGHNANGVKHRPLKVGTKTNANAHHNGQEAL